MDRTTDVQWARVSGEVEENSGTTVVKIETITHRSSNKRIEREVAARVAGELCSLLKS